MPRPIVIIGSGFSAAVCVLQCHAAGIAAKHITVIGPGVLGGGQAYGCVADEFRLNVRANLMKIWLDDEEHFPRWAAANIDDPKAETPAGTFYRRRDFVRYISAQITALDDHDDLTQIPAMVTAIAPMGDGWEISVPGTDGLAGEAIHAQTVILATGNPDPRWPIAEQPDDSGEISGLITKPWRGDWLPQPGGGSGHIKPDDHIAIIGAGLTAMDAVHGLACAGHKGQISVIAPHGILPPVQTDWAPVAKDADFKWPRPLRASGFLRVMRGHVGRKTWHEIIWQERFEALRIGINAAWQDLPIADRQKLARRVGWLWSLTRFRSGPQSVASLHQLQSAGQLGVIKGRLMGLHFNRGEWRLELEGRSHLSADRVINCTGMGRDALLADMQASGIIGVIYGSHPDVQPDQRLRRPDGSAHENLFMIGPATGPALGDVIGSASISNQAQRLAADLCKMFG